MSAILLPVDVDEPALRTLARGLAALARDGGVIHLEGELGAGKTTFARALLQAMGVGERVKSPTYSLIETYRIDGLDIHHLDLYRIADAGELEWLGLDDLLAAPALILVEWPNRGGDALPAPDVTILLAHVRDKRRFDVRTHSTRGVDWLRHWPAPSAPSDAGGDEALSATPHR